MSELYTGVLAPVLRASCVMPNPPANTIKMYTRNQGRILWSTIYRNANSCNKRRRIRQGLTCSRDADYNTRPHRDHHLSAPVLTLCSWVETITLCPFSEHPLAKRPPDRSLQFETASVHTMILHQQQREYEGVPCGVPYRSDLHSTSWSIWTHPIPRICWNPAKVGSKIFILAEVLGRSSGAGIRETQGLGRGRPCCSATLGPWNEFLLIPDTSSVLRFITVCHDRHRYHAPATAVDVRKVRR